MDKRTHVLTVSATKLAATAESLSFLESKKEINLNIKNAIVLKQSKEVKWVTVDEVSNFKYSEIAFFNYKGNSGIGAEFENRCFNSLKGPLSSRPKTFRKDAEDKENVKAVPRTPNSMKRRFK